MCASALLTFMDIFVVQVSQEWPGLPAGIKFDPSDVELLEHLEAKCGVGDSKAHMLIDEFIPTLEGDQGICYCHPENLPGKRFSAAFMFIWCSLLSQFSCHCLKMTVWLEETWSF